MFFFTKQTTRRQNKTEMKEEKYLDWEGQEQIWHVKSFPYHDFVGLY